MQISISNLCEPGDNVINLWRNPGLTLTPSVRPCPRQPHPLRPPPDLPFPSHPRPHPPPPPEAFALGSTWLTAVDLDLSITRQIKEGFRAHSCFSLRLAPASNPRRKRNSRPPDFYRGLLMKSFPAHMIGWDCHHTTTIAATAASAAATIPALPSHLRSPIPHLHWVYSCGNSKWLCAFSVCIHPLPVCGWVCVCLYIRDTCDVCVCRCVFLTKLTQPDWLLIGCLHRQLYTKWHYNREKIT